MNQQKAEITQALKEASRQVAKAMLVLLDNPELGADFAKEDGELSEVLFKIKDVRDEFIASMRTEANRAGVTVRESVEA